MAVLPFCRLDNACQDDTGFDERTFHRFEGLVADHLSFDDALDSSCRVSKYDEANLVRASGAVDPALQLHLRAVVLACTNIANPRVLRHLYRSLRRASTISRRAY